MSGANWIGWIVAAACALAAILYLYRKREPAGKGRTVLALLRWAAIAILLLLLFDPRLATPDDAGTNRAPVLLDGSLSMLMPADNGSRWDVALGEARRRAGSDPVTVFGDVPRRVPLDSARPEATASRLLPALQAAAEAGAQKVIVVTDGGVQDAEAVSSWLPRLGVGVEWVRADGGGSNASISAMRAPAWAEAGESVPVELDIQGTGAADSIRIALRQDGRLLGTGAVAAPAAGRTSQIRMQVTPTAPAGGGHVRIDATIDDDSFADDNRRTAYVHVSDEPAGIVLVSFQPDWEPRFLLPVLERATGLPARGYLPGPAGTWLRVGTGLDAGQRATDAVVRRGAAAADLLVVHGSGNAAPAWVTEAIQDARRVILLPAADATELPVPAQLGSFVQDDWFVAPDVPASPVAPLLAGMSIDDVPPLDGLFVGSAAAGNGTWSPLSVTRGRRGPASPLVLAGEAGRQRWAVALGSGYWRWAFRGDVAQDVYNRLWSSVGGWLMRDTRSVDIAAVRPVSRVVERGMPIRWVTRSGKLDSVQVRLARTDTAGGLTATAMIAANSDTAAQAPIPPGTYRYETTAYEGDVTTTAAGELTVERYSPEFARATTNLENVSAATSLRGMSAGDTRPLHTSFVPYVLLLVLLCSEWILRRRWGLR